MFLESTSRNFDRLGELAASQFCTKGVTLTDAVVKIAQQEKLNPVELERLVQKANTAATLQLLGSDHGGNIEFELADYADAMNKIYPSTKTTHSEKSEDVEKTAGEVPFSLPDLRRQARAAKGSAALPTLEKTASVKTVPPQKLVFQASHKVESIRQEKLACELGIQKNLDYLLSEFHKVRCPDFGKFASETYSLYGEKARPVLTSLAQALREPQDFSKTAEIIDDRTSIHRKFKDTLSGLSTLVKLSKDLASATVELNDCRSTLREALRC